jgi:heme-degrading monooxygenase HmoA
MIKVFEGYKLKAGADIRPVLLKLRSYALTCPGFVGAENLVSEKDSSIVTMISMWEEVENWRMWERSEISHELHRQAEDLLVEEPRVTAYRIIPTVGWPR